MSFKLPTLLLALSFAIVGCGGDDDDMNAASADIVGTWRLETARVFHEISVDGVASSSDQVLTQSDVTIDFNADGTYAQRGFGTYEIAVKNILQDTVFVLEIDHGQTGTYAIVNGQIEGYIATRAPGQATGPPAMGLKVNVTGEILTIEFPRTIETMALPQGNASLTREIKSTLRRE